MLSRRDDDWWKMFWMMSKSIWLGRKAWIFEGKKVEFIEVMNKAVRGVMEVDKVNSGQPTKMVRGAEVVVWSAPSKGVYKLNTDAVVLKDKGIGMGGVVRDVVGDMMATTYGMASIVDAEIVEALSARNGIQIALKAGL